MLVAGGTSKKGMIASMPQTAIEHMTLALKVLSDRYKRGGPGIERADVEKLKTFLGDEAQGLADDQIACAVIEKEVRKLRAARTKEKNTPTQR
jgi:hypothetical protein